MTVVTLPGNGDVKGVSQSWAGDNWWNVLLLLVDWNDHKLQHLFQIGL